jgi:hypothetical protein
MTYKIITYLTEFWSPEKIILLALAAGAYLIKFYHVNFYQSYCFTGEGLRNSPCSQSFLEVFYTPLSSVDNELLFFFLILLILPLSLLHSWFKYIASWSVPLGILVYLSGIPTEPGPGSMFAPAFNAASMLGIAVSAWIYLLLGFVVFTIGKYFVASKK